MRWTEQGRFSSTSSSPSPGEPPAPEEPDKPDLSGLKYVCREYVRESLLAPATAEFQPTRKMAAGWLGDNRAAVEAYVDAQNGFGALIRTNYRCEALSRGNGRWTLVDVSVLD